MNKILLPILCLFTFACTTSQQKTTEKQPKTYPVGLISTPLGDMFFWLHDETPGHKASFIELANKHYWDTLTFNRVIENFVIQGGCPDTPEGFGDSPYLLKPEFNDKIKHIYGAVGAGRDDNPEKLSAGCQLYIVQNKDGLPRLDGDYMIFGQIFQGFDVLDRIAAVETDSLDQPLRNVPMEVRVLELTAEQLKTEGFEVKE
jgi:peptidyl-prolyl cis-trans isomerase B (cyclophilin B)